MLKTLMGHFKLASFNAFPAMIIRVIIVIIPLKHIEIFYNYATTKYIFSSNHKPNVTQSHL
jgi:hypothetical protein